MGIAIKDLIITKEISFDDLRNKILVVDTSNLLYQFLSSIRQRDGSLLSDTKGDITSHLVGLSSRIPRLMEKDIKLVFVLDGKFPVLKKKERERRKELKIEAEKKYKEAVKKKDLEEMKKYATRTTRLTKDMIKEAEKLIEVFGLPIVQAPSEAEAQTAHMVKKEDAFASLTQDFDALMFGSDKLVRNLSLVGKKKKVNQLVYESIKPEIVDLGENLNNLGIDQNQLIALAMLIGTDYNPGGIKGIGPKNALKLVKQHGSDFDALFNDVKWDKFFEFPWTEVYYLIKNMPVTDKYKLEWKEIDKEKIIKLLVDEHDFSEERVNSVIEKLSKKENNKKQKGLSNFF